MHYNCTKDGILVLCRDKILEESIAAHLTFDIVRQQDELSKPSITLASIAEKGPKAYIDNIANLKEGMFDKLLGKMSWLTDLVSSKKEKKKAILNQLQEEARALQHSRRYKEPCAEVLKGCAKRILQNAVEKGNLHKRILQGISFFLLSMRKHSR
jgi:hypothetical protein